MSRVLMIEGRVNFSGIILPEKIQALGHGYVLPAARGSAALECLLPRVVMHE